MRSTVEAFQTFLKIADRSQWVADPALRRNLVLVARDLAIELPSGKDNASEIALFSHFLSQVINRQDVLSRRHLQAFCDEPRLSAIRRHRYRDLANPQESDYFLKSISVEAVEALIGDSQQLDRALEKYLNRTDLDCSLRDYLVTELFGKIGGIYSDWFGQGNKSVWYQLKRVSARKLQEKLRLLGVVESELSEYCRVREWLYRVFTNPDAKRRWPDPTEAQYGMATQLYNSNEASTRLSIEEFTGRVETCVKALVHQFSFQEVNEEAMGTPIEAGLLDRLIEVEDAVEQNYLYALLEETIEFLSCWLQELRWVDPLLYQVALMRYGSGMSQQAIAAAVGLTRDRVRSRCGRIYRQALAALQTSEQARTLVAAYECRDLQQAWERMVEQLLPISARRQPSIQDLGHTANDKWSAITNE